MADFDSVLEEFNAWTAELETEAEHHTIRTLNPILQVGYTTFSLLFRELDTNWCSIHIKASGKKAEWVQVYSVSFLRDDLEGSPIHDHLRKTLMEAADLYLRHLPERL